MQLKSPHQMTLSELRQLFALYTGAVPPELNDIERRADAIAFNVSLAPTPLPKKEKVEKKKEKEPEPNFSLD